MNESNNLYLIVLINCSSVFPPVSAVLQFGGIRKKGQRTLYSGDEVVQYTLVVLGNTAVELWLILVSHII